MRLRLDAVNPEGRRSGDGWLRPALLPARCLLCLAEASPGKDLCSACWCDLPWIGARCLRCALPLPFDDICGHRQQSQMAYDTVRSPFLYQTPVDALLKGLKFHKRLAIARFLGLVMTKHMRDTGEALPDLLVPVPLHRRRLSERGFNQSIELARTISRALSIRTDTQVCDRIRYTDAQSGMTAAERRRNLRSAFQIRASSLPHHIAIVDDVMTTGATVQSLAEVLRRAGAERIDVWVCARTPE